MKHGNEPMRRNTPSGAGDTVVRLAPSGRFGATRAGKLSANVGARSGTCDGPGA
jgi:hypothetical protein